MTQLLSTRAAISDQGIGDKRFLDPLLRKLGAHSEDVFCYYYASHSSHLAVNYSNLIDLVLPKINLLNPQISPGTLLFIIEDDTLEQISWWLAALFVNATPGILTDRKSVV